MSFSFGVLDPGPTEEAGAHNAALLGQNTLGIEVTVPSLATRCGLGNIDPQHSGGRAELAAIHAALSVALPPDGATLVTVRPDLDAIGAMVILCLRAEGALPRRLEGGEADFQIAWWDRIDAVAIADKFAKGEWPGHRPLASFGEETAGVEDNSALAPIAAAIADFKIPIATRVQWMRDWLLTGAEPEGYRARWEAEQAAIAAALADGTIAVSEAAGGRIAVVQSSHRAATAIGYRLAPVVVALNPAFRLGGGEEHQKFTVCQFADGYVDMSAARDDLVALEPGWGGSPTIIGSPQGVGSTLAVGQVVEVVSRHLLK